MIENQQQYEGTEALVVKFSESIAYLKKQKQTPEIKIQIDALESEQKVFVNDMVMFKEIKRQTTSAPGETIQELMDLKGISFEAFYLKMNLSPDETEELIHGFLPITHDIAKQLEKALDVPKNFWIKREQNYREKLYESVLSR